MAKDKRRKKVSNEDKVPVTNDERFISVHNDPRFAPPRRKDAKLKVDKRFERMYKDESFTAKARVDRYGRKIGKDAGKEEIKRYYHISDEGEEEEEEEEEDTGRVYDPARGEGVVSTSEESSDEEGDEIGEVEEQEVRAAVKVQKEIPVGDVSRRFATVNLDWDNVRAVDLMKAFSSFVTGGGRVVSVTVYPSEFGKERMGREEIEGPPTEIFKPKGKSRVIESDDESDLDEVTEKTIIKEDKGEEFDSEKLRNYQLERLRYFYAVVECDSPGTAKHIYDQCDGAEYEATANFFDLRFIPDETSFEDDKPRDKCTEIPANYKPNEFATDALQHSKVKLTWDEDDQQRKIATKRAFSQRDIEDVDLKDYLASSDSESETEVRETAKDRYRALLSATGFGKKDKDEPAVNMEVTFTSGLSKKPKGGKVIEENEEETTIAKYARKEKERRQCRKEKMKTTREGKSGGGKDEKGEEDNREDKTEELITDLGFDDPFFADAPAAKSAEREGKKRRDREAKAAEAAETASKRAELELLMADEDADGKKLRHFDMKQIVKAEKKKGKKGKYEKGEAEPEGIQDGFEIDVKDPRFAAVYEKHEFAIDPTNPRFVKTKAMSKLLEERRNRTLKRNEGDPDEEEGEGKRKRRKVEKGGEDKDELKRLVQSLKSKAKK